MYVDKLIEDTFRIPQPEGRGQYLRLDQNENVDGIPDWLFKETIEKITPSFLSTYPEETKLTEKYARSLGLKLENVTLTDGSVVGMGYLIKVLGEPGKTLVCVTPTFGMYKVYAEMNKMNVTQIRYENDLSFDINKLLSAIDDNTGIVVLVNPNMPIGNTYSMEDMRKVLDKAKKHDALVIVDEAYYYFHDKSAVGFLSEYDNLAILRTFSKMLSIPALRLGAIISNKRIIQCINNYKPHYTVNSVALLFGEAIIDNHDRLTAELDKNFREGYRYITSELENAGYTYIPSAGCFICIRPKYKTSEQIYDELKENKILVLCGTGDLTGYIRLSVCGKKHMDKFLKTLLSIDRL